MCGIFGHYSFSNVEYSEHQIESMGQAISHRGPDGQGIYFTPKLSLGNQRLAILDIEHGQQPFVSDCGNIVVVQNGEIFNHVELADELSEQGFECKTHCDTEVILRLYERDGIDGISKLNGMFAISIFDKNKNTMYLIRDRVGEKPLHYFYDGNSLVFSSEIKSILKVIDKPPVCSQAIEEFFSFNYIPQPRTIFENIFHVETGSYLEINEQGISLKKWWDLSKVETQNKTEQEWISEFNTILDDAVRIRLRADVPFGAFLSGGVDSSSVVGLMAKHLSEPVKTYSIGFDDKKYDESPYAEEAAVRFSTEHHLKKVDPNMLDLWEKVLYHCDQPHGDVSFMPTYKVAEMAAADVKMVLTGDGADELFAGYDKYLHFFKDNRAHNFDADYHKQLTLFPKDKLDQLLTDEYRSNLRSEVVKERLEPLLSDVQHMDDINKALYIDTQLLLSGNNLVKPDRTGMAVSIENRAPFLDYRLIELAFSMPGELKLRNSETKYIYKKAVEDLIGTDLAYRKKQMFTVPIGDWFKTTLKDLCVDLLISPRTQARGFFNYDFVARLFEDHVNDRENNTREIRALMAFELWCRRFLD
ncbi:asparagine synthase (glutamine-hydrolyzing) [Pseudoalteromonas rubra]|uniref:asparagine synthase (glutamine-hydrolyzing) n=1 Tax=Pseudoalteromonas rubra TaxID=43658 RepID=UPI002DC058F9|nr:asparagine synthase (glutamine-hydrolyzing) [Pseudoalteromonas rubra]MEC4089944.1 asparagine synthase (glutamine-hydrolyzing) [Pseudoalteromonas rubra]